MKCKKCKKEILEQTHKELKGYCPACAPAEKDEAE